MKLKKLLNLMDFGGLYLIIYMEDEEDPIWEGKQMDVPYWLSNCKIKRDSRKWGEEPISYRNTLGKNRDNEPGFVICLKE